MNNANLNIDILFEPAKIGHLKLPNRIAMAPMTRRLSPGGIPTMDVADYYARRARGGAGLIFTEGTLVNHPASGGFVDVPDFFGQPALDGWKRVVDAVHRADGLIIPQLWHLGNVRRKGMPPNPDEPGIGPENIFDNGDHLVRRMTERDIADVISAFSEAAYQAVKLGFDGVAIHGAHGYLLDQFCWSKTNRRNDSYGGSLENRLRFSKELVQSVRATIGPETPIVYRFSQWKIHDYSAQIVETDDDLESMLGILAGAGVDIFDVSTRRFWETWNNASNEELATATRRLSKRPVIAVGSVGVNNAFSADQVRGSESLHVGANNIDLAAEHLKAGNFDCIALGRALLADPEWPNKVRHRKFDTIVPYRKDIFLSLT